VESQGSRAGLLRGMYVCAVASIAALALTIAPAGASAASPVLEFSSPGNSFPIPFEAEGGAVSARMGEYDTVVECDGSEGEGEITGPHSTLSIYFFTGCATVGGSKGGQKCTTPGAEEEEIWSEEIEAELVYIDQTKHEVAMLLNPQEGVYMEFECGGEPVKASGSFLSPVDPVNKLAPSFTAILRRSGNGQIPNEYEDLNGVKHDAIPKAEVGVEPLDNTGVELDFTIYPEVPLEIRSVNTAEVEAKQRQEEAAAKKRQEDEAAAKKHQEEEAAAKKRQEDEAATKKRQEAEAAEKKRQEEAAALLAGKQLEEAKAKAKRQLTKALTQCNKVEAKGKRVQCKKRARNKYSARTGSAKPKG